MYQLQTDSQGGNNKTSTTRLTIWFNIHWSHSGSHSKDRCISSYNQAELLPKLVGFAAIAYLAILVTLHVGMSDCKREPSVKGNSDLWDFGEFTQLMENW